MDRQHNQPIPPTRLIGRERQLAEVRARLCSQDVHLVTLTGPGGIGKTRLALQVAANLLDSFADGVYFVNLAPLVDSDFVLSTVAHTLGVESPDTISLPDALRQHLHAKALLLVLDNFEHLQAAAPFVSNLLADAPNLRVLVTSRAPLHLSGEHEYPVPPLALPPSRQLPALESLSQYEAVALFIQRAVAIKPNFQITQSNAPAVAEICARLDGLPLAIELAAARIKVLPPEALLARLSSRLQVLTGGARDLPKRHQTLRATIGWSHDLLTADERRLFRRMAVFQGGGTLGAFEQVCNTKGDLGVDMLDGVASLLDKNLLYAGEGVEGEPRYWMLETIHEYAREQLEASGEGQDIRKGHLEYFLALAEKAETEAIGVNQQVGLDRLETERANLHTALEWSLTARDTQSALRLAGALYGFWRMRNHQTEGRKWLAAALTQGEAQDATPARANAVIALAQLTASQGDYADASLHFEHGLGLWRQLDDKPHIADALSKIGMLNYHEGKYDRAQSLFEEGLDVAHVQDDKYLMARNLFGLARVADAEQDVRAEAYYEECLALFRAIGNTYFNAMVLADLACLAISRHEYSQAIARGEEALALFQTFKDEGNVAWVEGLIGEALHRSGEHGRALSLLCKSLKTSQDIGDKPIVIGTLSAMAATLNALGHPVDGVRLLAASQASSDAFEIPNPPNSRALLDHDVNLAREQLGEDNFAKAWSAGRALTLEQAVAYALASAEALVPVTPVTQSFPAVTTRKTHPAGLSAREVEVLCLIAEGLTDAQVAEKLVLSPRTVNAHLQSIYNKIGVNSRIAATRFAVDNGLV